MSLLLVLFFISVHCDEKTTENRVFTREEVSTMTPFELKKILFDRGVPCPNCRERKHFEEQILATNGLPNTYPQQPGRRRSGRQQFQAGKPASPFQKGLDDPHDLLRNKRKYPHGPTREDQFGENFKKSDKSV
eukprot:TRINITY_DN1245_c0_g2_i5.p1 TRINITY_DN1245_c0_g2~~TRINITY_DN1245_c0_g2_i5.p1  ORF type:complete len:133 (+),score=24.33 TRINITY_DN1245_c0_g2_i5:77-475(+)